MNPIQFGAVLTHHYHYEDPDRKPNGGTFISPQGNYKGAQENFKPERPRDATEYVALVPLGETFDKLHLYTRQEGDNITVEANGNDLTENPRALIKALQLVGSSIAAAGTRQMMADIIATAFTRLRGSDERVDKMAEIAGDVKLDVYEREDKCELLAESSILDLKP